MRLVEFDVLVYPLVIGPATLIQLEADGADLHLRIDNVIAGVAPDEGWRLTAKGELQDV